MGDEPVMIANPYRAAIGEAIERARPPVADCHTALDNALLAMKQLAWTSKTADAFYAELTAQDRAAGQAGQDCLETLQQAHDRQDLQVVAGGPEARWQRMYGELR